jgi:hypothetical protein
MKKWRIDRIISIATLVTSAAALILVLKRPAPVARPQTPAQAAANAQSFQDKLSQFEQATQKSQQLAQTTVDSVASPSPEQDTEQPANATSASSSTSPAQPAEAHFTSDEISAALAQAAGALPAATGQLSPDTDLGSMPAIEDQQVSFDGNVVHGQFLTKIGGKDVWVTVSGKLGEKDGYATFDPTEFKVGDLNVPVSLVNGPLQKKLAEQRDRLKLPDSVGGMQVQDGQLVLKQK